ncbi:MAG: hypothetical protein QXS02_03725 [Candidatus Thermoplasmatota archaeon]
MKSKILVITSMVVLGMLVFLPSISAVEIQTAKTVNKTQLLKELKDMDVSSLQAFLKGKRKTAESTGLLTILITMIILLARMILTALPVLVQLLIIILI